MSKSYKARGGNKRYDDDEEFDGNKKQGYGKNKSFRRRRDKMTPKQLMAAYVRGDISDERD